MSLCDTCKDPGFCCREIPLLSGRRPMFFEAGKSPVALGEWALSRGLPFLPLRPFYSVMMSRAEVDSEKPFGIGMPIGAFLFGEVPTDAVHGHFWLWMCPHLLPSGRCGNYANRPDLCRTFEPGSDALCVHYSPAQSKDIQKANTQ